MPIYITKCKIRTVDINIYHFLKSIKSRVTGNLATATVYWTFPSETGSVKTNLTGSLMTN